MSDIVKKLLAPVSDEDDYMIGQWPGEPPKEYDVLRIDAANEIERLRAWNEEIALNARHFAESLRLIRDMGPMTVDDQRWRVAKDALEGK